MDGAVSIEGRLEAMKIFYDSEISTTCFISPIFPGITNVTEFIERLKNICNLIWLDNLYHEIYSKKNIDYWRKLGLKIIFIINF